MAFLKKVGSYQLTERLGKGNFGKVFKGTNTQGETFAIKCISKNKLNLRPQLFDYLKREITTLQSIDSPYVTKLYDAIETGNNVYLIMEYCGGQDLDKTMKGLTSVPMHLAKRWLTNIVDGFLALTAKEIMHRDLKPANVILTDIDLEQAYAKVIDFGLAKFNVHNEAMIDQSYVGTRLYMAPELLYHQPYNPKVDVWSFGVLASTVLGTRLFVGIKDENVLKERQRDCLLGEFNLPKDAEEMLRSALSYNPQTRPSFEELRQMPFFQPIPSVIPPSIPVGLGHSEEGQVPLMDIDAMTGQKLQMFCSLNTEIKAAWDLGWAKLREDKALLAFGIFQICLKWKRKCREEIQGYLGQGRDEDLERLFTEAEAAVQEAESRLTDADLSNSLVQYNDEGCKISPRLFFKEAEEISNRVYHSQIPLEEQYKQYNEALGLLLMVKEEQANEQQQGLVDWLCNTISDIEKLMVS